MMSVGRIIARVARKLSPGFRTEKLKPALVALESGCRVLDVGAWCAFPEPNPSENWLEKHAVGKGRVLAVGLEDMRDFRRAYPNVWCVQADGCDLPFADHSIDVAVSNAVLEHVTEERRADFVRELFRVAKRWAWFSVPDRWCPVEVHTKLPLVHWLPFWRRALRWCGHAYWALPSSLDLYTKRRLRKLLESVHVAGGAWSLTRQHWYGIPVSLLVRYERNGKEGDGR